MEFRLLQPKRLIWTTVLCTVLIFNRGVLSGYNDERRDYSPMNSDCALRLERTQTSYKHDPYEGSHTKQPLEIHYEYTRPMSDEDIEMMAVDEEEPVEIGHKYKQPAKKHYHMMESREMDDEDHMEPVVRHRVPRRAVNRETCIRYRDVDDALEEAKKKLHFKPVAVNSFEVDENDIDRVANLIIETTRILARRFQLTFEEIDEGLPTIDTSKTGIWDVCPAKFKPINCPKSRFRSIDGHCSSFRNSVWGSVGTPFDRLLPPAYSNGIDSPRVSPVDGHPLPHVRAISSAVHPDISDLSERVSILLMSWGQFVDHDLTLGAFARDENGALRQCCRRKTHPNCMPIEISKKDPFYSRFGSTCMEFMRTIAGLREGCRLGPRTQTNLVSTRMDANFIYGNTKSEARRLRVGTKGLLKSWPKFSDLGLKDLLPPLTENPDMDCIGRPRHKFCFLTGDTRANVQPHVTVLHTIYVRDHNRIAKELGYLNLHWDDERIYQETRNILAATVQHIAYNEFLPVLLGPAYMEMFNLTLKKEGYWYGYDKNTPIGTILPFQTAAFRFGHTLIHGKVRLHNKYHKFLDSWDLRNVLQQPFNIYQPGMIDKIIAGFLNTPIQTFDPFMTSEVTKHLFQVPNASFGLDLASLNLMRGREHAIPGYNDYREWCGLPRVKTFKELDYYLKNGTAFKFSKLYKHPDEIELWTAGLSERPVEGGVVGPTFACIIAYQFNMIRKGDRFWYENPGFPSSFTPAQLGEIRKVTQAKVICENADDIPTTQMWVLLMPNPKHNPRVLCKDLPQINLKYWIEDPKTESFKYPK